MFIEFYSVAESTLCSYVTTFIAKYCSYVELFIEFALNDDSKLG
jgi:hypothetical protein